MIHSNLLGINHWNFIKMKLDGNETPWFRSSSVANFNDPKKPYAGGFAHLIYSKEKGAISNLFEITFPILLQALDRQNLLLKDLYRIRLGMFTRVPEEIIHPAHKDNPDMCPQPHTVGMYYPIHSDGDTTIYNETTESENYTIKEKCTPTGNVWFNFDGNLYHSSSAPQKHDTRIAITYNYVVEKDDLS